MPFEKVGYEDGAVALTALYARPAAPARAAVAVYPTFMNTTPAVEAKAAALVDAGYAVLIGDFYGPEAPSDAEQAFAAMGRLRGDPPAMRQRLRAIWPDTRGLRVLGVGYASPYLLGFREVSERVLTFMTARQGAHRWPPGEAGLAALVEDAELPLPEASMDRVLLVHALEHTEHTQTILREVWRVMAPEGRLLLVVPNRRGLWARLERTPFGTGHPYSPPQLANLLRSSMFVPVETQAALYFPPSRRRMVLRAAGTMERLGTRFGRVSFGGALIVEATKQVYAVSNQGPYTESVRRRRARAALPLGTSGRAHSGSCAARALEPEVSTPSSVQSHTCA